MSETRSGSRSGIGWAGRVLVLAGLYVLGARLGLELAFDNRNVTAVWPASGIAVAGLLLWGRFTWPGIAIGALAANLTNGAGLSTAVAIAVGNTIAPFVAAAILRQLRVRESLEEVRDVFLLVLVGVLAMTISATTGTAALAATDALGAQSIRSVWLVWWVGDAVGVVLFTPFLLLAGRLTRKSALLRRPVEGAVLLVASGLTAYGALHFSRPLVFLVAIPIIWAVLRFEQPGAAFVVVIVSTIAVLETAAGHGQFAMPSRTITDNLMTMQVFNVTVGFCSVALAAVMFQRTRVERALRTSEERFRRVFEQASDLVCVHDAGGRLTSVNATTEHLTGYSRDRLLTMNIIDLVAPESVRRVRRTIDHHLAGDLDTATYEVEMVATNGRRVAMELNSTPIDIDGEAPEFQIIGRDITIRRLAEDELRRASLHDELTGLPNRTLLNERLEYALAIARRDGTRVVLAIADLDDFKAVNERATFEEGDRILAAFASRLRSAFRDPDTVARLESDEFAILAPSLAAGRSPEVIAEQVRAEVDEDITVSIGVAVFPEHANDAEGLCHRADIALHDAKRMGGARHSVYRPELDSHEMRRFTLEDELHAAVAEKTFGLVFQPTIETSTMRTTSVEALLRWTHHSLGAVPPTEIIPLAIATNLMDAITDWVLAEAVARCALWNVAGFDLGISVNLAPTDLHPVTADRIHAHLSEHELSPERLTVEVRESDVRSEASHAALHRIAELGVRIAIDDFGTGTSSLAHLSRLPLSALKIDRSFVTGIVSSPKDHAVARSIIELAHNLQLTAIAEGVETRGAWGALETLGCDAMQGRMMCPPLPANELEAWLRTPSWSGRVR